MTLRTWVLVVGLFAAVPAARAAPDEGQSAVATLLESGQARLRDIEHMPVAERGLALHEHMSLVGHAYAAAKALQPRAGLPAKERLAWQMGQQKLLEGVIEQLLDNHHLMQEMAGR